MNEVSTTGLATTEVAPSIFTILGGTTVPDRAAIVRAECREGSRVELRRADADGSSVDVWLDCRSRLGLRKAWKRIGHVPAEAAAPLLAVAEVGSTVVGHGTVQAVIAPAGRDEAVVTVEISPRL